MEKEEILKMIIQKIVEIFVAFSLYLPIIAGIITPMIYLIPVAYFSWFIFGYMSSSNIGSLRWIEGYILLSSEMKIVFITVESILFMSGLVLFSLGLYFLAKGRKKQKLIVKEGPYKHIRHPQLLGILLMTLPFSFYVPWTHDIGIRAGDILSVSVFIVCISIISDLEEYKMRKKYPEQYEEYRNETCAFVPLLCNKLKGKLDTKLSKILKYVGFVLFIGLIYLLLYLGSIKGFISYVFTR